MRIQRTEFPGVEYLGYYHGLSSARGIGDVDRRVLISANGVSADACFLYRNALVRRVLTDEGTFSPSIIDEHYRSVLGSRSLNSLSGIPHQRLRSAAATMFDREVLASVRREVIRPLAIRCFRDLTSVGGGDLVSQVAEVLPGLVVLRLLGLGDEPLEPVRQASLAALRFSDNPKKGLAAGRLLRRVVNPLVEGRGSQIAERVRAECKSLGTNDDDLRSLFVLLLAAGIVTTESALANMLWVLAHFGGCIGIDLATPAEIAREAVRWEAPVEYVVRRAVRAAKLGSERVHEGEVLICHLSSANHDERAIQNPEEFAPRRPDVSRGLAFGAGRHYCLGRLLALSELEVVAEEFGQLDPLRLTSVVPQPRSGYGIFRSPLAITMGI